MPHRNRPKVLQPLDLPAEFEDLDGLLEADLNAIVHMISERAGDRLLLTRREQALLRYNLWNRLALAVNQSLEPLSAELR